MNRRRFLSLISQLTALWPFRRAIADHKPLPARKYDAHDLYRDLHRLDPAKLRGRTVGGSALGPPALVLLYLETKDERGHHHWQWVELKELL